MRARLAGSLALAAILALLALGWWQVERLRWKLALIAQVEARLAAAPVTAPGPPAWQRIGPDKAYTRVRIAGRWRGGQDVRVQAVTDLGPGFWMMSPLVADAGWTVLVNRGFAPAGVATPTPRPALVIGLLRPTEPGGGFLRANDPVAGRWYSRDTGAIAARLGITHAAPYFIDADGPRTGWPRGGMTIVRFRNHHLIYALTWFGLAALLGFLWWRARRSEPAA